jgi:hypothetical protein
MNDSLGERADAQHPWIGLASFTEGDRSFFAGRGDEIEDLLRLVRRDTLTLLYGVSGLGKTSLVQAGLFPALREENILPVPIRLDYLEGALPLAFQILNAVSAAAIAAKVEAPQPRPDETLWEYFHREGNHFWSARNDLVTPFLAFDQFEEFFTLGRETPARAAQAGAFIEELADLIENRPPVALRDDPLRAKGFNFKPAPLKVLLAMREDYLADLDRIRSHFRALGQNRLRLLPMGEKQARQVIALGAPLLAPGVEERIVQHIAGGAADADEITVAPALLSLVLRELNERRLARGPEAKITPDLLDVEQHKIFEDFYLRTLADFSPNVRLFIEDELLTASGHRNSCALDDALTRPDVTLPVLNELVNRRLLAYEDRHHTRRVELTHDVLVPVIRASRDSRLTREALAQAERLRAEQVAQRRKQRITLAVACALAIALVATIWGGYYFFVQEHKAYYSDMTKRNGFPVGVLPVSESNARKLAVSYLLVHKGITRDGWRFRWKPAFRMVAVNSQLKPTSNHSIGTYLWQKNSSDEAQGDLSQRRAERLGLRTICQWEFDSNAQGEVIYERALDRDGHMISGFIYSPRGSGASNTRLARFVSPDGFTQLQSGSEAEYVLIHYDSQGWEDRITYRDGKNLPAAGPDGAFGQSREHNSRGQTTLLLSLDADGKRMIDNVGNCGMRVTFNEKGFMTEAHSLGPDLQPMPVKDGWVILKQRSDDLGRALGGTYYGLKGEPVLHREGYHGWTAEYDEHGNQTATTYIGLDGKPTLLTVGFATQRSSYNTDGQITRTSYHGVNGEPVLHKDGCQAWEVQYDQRGNEVARSFLGLDGKPALHSLGYASERSVYNARGKLTRTSYHGVNGEATLRKEGYHAWELEFDEHGNEVQTRYFGVDNQPIVLPAGYASYAKKYDSDGNVLELAYFDAAGKPTLDRESGVHKVLNTYDGRGKVTGKTFHGINGERILSKYGYHGWEARYDDRGNEAMLTYVDRDEKPIIIPAGYAMTESAHNAQGKTTRVIYRGVNQEPVRQENGYYGWEAEYDERGNALTVTYFGLDGKPTLNEKKYAIEKTTYDSRGKVTKNTFYGVDGKPARHKEGYYGWEAQYDDRGNRISQTGIGPDGKPGLLFDGYATIKLEFDARSNIIRRTYYDAEGKSTVQEDWENHGYEAQYDDHGNQTTKTYIGLDGKPFRLSDGYATVKSEYNSRNQITRQAFYGTTDQPVLWKNSYHGGKWQYDERGNEIAAAFFGKDGKPQLLAENYATVHSAFDSSGRVIKKSFFGVNEEAIVHKEGYHGWELQYDEHGNEIVLTFFDVDGKPVTRSGGYAIVKNAYDSQDKLTQRTFYDVNGERVLIVDGYHGWNVTYDERGKEVAKVFIDVDGKPLTLKRDKRSSARP